MMDFIKYGTLSRTRLWFARLLRVCFILCLLCACTREYPPFGSPNQGNGHRGESGPFRPDYLPSGQDSAQISSKSLYLCGVRYPDGYDWVKDEQKGSVPAKATVFQFCAYPLNRISGVLPSQVPVTGV